MGTKTEPYGTPKFKWTYLIANLQPVHTEKKVIQNERSPLVLTCSNLYSIHQSQSLGEIKQSNHCA